jgi:Replication-relaxation
MRHTRLTSKIPLVRTKQPQSKKHGLKRRELEILKAVASLNVATAEDLRHLLGMHSRPYFGELLKELSGGMDCNQRGYLYRFGTAHAPGNFRRLYALTRRGRQALQAHGVEVAGWYNPKKASLYSLTILTHHLAVSQLLVALTLFVRKYPEFQLVETRPWFAMAGNPPRVTFWTEGEETTITVIPDAYVYIERDHEDPSKVQGFDLLIEVDRGTESKEKFQHHLVLERINLIRHKGYEAYFNATSAILVFLAVGATRDYRLNRLHTMRQWTAEVLAHEELSDWASAFRFSTIDEGLYDTLMLFTDPVCYLPDSDTLVPLFPPPTDEENSDGQTTHATETRTTAQGL